MTHTCVFADHIGRFDYQGINRQVYVFGPPAERKLDLLENALVYPLGKERVKEGFESEDQGKALFAKA